MQKRKENCLAQCSTCRLLSLRKRALSRHVDAVIGISRYILTLHRQFGFFPAANGHVIRNIAEPPTASHLSTHTREGRLVLGFLGRLSPEKGLEPLISAIRAITNGNTTTSLRVGGWGDAAYESKLRKLAQGLPIEFLGKVTPDEFFSGIDVLVVPSTWNEPLGRIVLEAYGYGTPVLAARRGGLPELIRPAQTGWTYEPNDQRSLPSLIEAIISMPDKVRAMRAECRRDAEAFTMESVARKHLDIYRRYQNRKSNSMTGAIPRPQEALNP